MKKDKLFAEFKVPFIKVAKERNIKVVHVSERLLRMEIDDVPMRIERVGSGIKLQCGCNACGAQNVANGTLCGRQVRAVDYLLRKSGKVSEIEVRA